MFFYVSWMSDKLNRQAVCHPDRRASFSHGANCRTPDESEAGYFSLGKPHTGF